MLGRIHDTNKRREQRFGADQEKTKPSNRADRRSNDRAMRGLRHFSIRQIMSPGFTRPQSHAGSKVPHHLRVERSRRRSKAARLARRLNRA